MRERARIQAREPGIGSRRDQSEAIGRGPVAAPAGSVMPELAGTRQAYHALTLGFYEGELLRCVDPQHRSLGQFFQDEIALPLTVVQGNHAPA
jgi:hypothetical protein